MEPTPPQPPIYPPQSVQPPQPLQSPPAWHSLNYNPPPVRESRPVQPLTINGKVLTSGWIVGLTLAALMVLCGCFGSGYMMGMASTAASATATTGTNAGVVNQPTQQTQPTAPVTPIPTAPGATATPSNIVLTVSGNGDKTTATFTVRGTWQLAWTCHDGSQDFSAWIYYSNGGNLSDVDYTCPASGTGGDSSIFHSGGTFYLEIISNVYFTITVTDLPN